MRDIATIHPYPGHTHILFNFNLIKWDHSEQSLEEWVSKASKFMEEYVSSWYSKQECEGNLIMQAEQLIKAEV